MHNIPTFTCYLHKPSHFSAPEWCRCLEGKIHLCRLANSKWKLQSRRTGDSALQDNLSGTFGRRLSYNNLVRKGPLSGHYRDHLIVRVGIIRVARKTIASMTPANVNRFCNHFSITPWRLAGIICTNYPGSKLVWGVGRFMEKLEISRQPLTSSIKL